MTPWALRGLIHDDSLSILSDSDRPPRHATGWASAAIGRIWPPEVVVLGQASARGAALPISIQRSIALADTAI